MIEYKGIRLDMLSMDLTAAPPRRSLHVMAMRRHRFYHQHELAIWTVFVLASIMLWTFSLSNNANVFWHITTPLLRYIP